MQKICALPIILSSVSYFPLLLYPSGSELKRALEKKAKIGAVHTQCGSAL